MIECSTWQSWLPWWWACGPEDLWLTAFSLLGFIVAKGEKCASGRALPLRPCCYLRSCQGGGRHGQGPGALLKSISPHERAGNLFCEITVYNQPRKIWFSITELTMWLVWPHSWSIINTLFLMIKSKPACTTWLLGHMSATTIIITRRGKEHIFISFLTTEVLSLWVIYFSNIVISAEKMCGHFEGRIQGLMPPPVCSQSFQILLTCSVALCYLGKEYLYNDKTGMRHGREDMFAWTSSPFL